MAVRHHLVDAPPEQVWEVLADGYGYVDWVIGTSSSRPLDDDWPEVGSQIEYTISLGRWALTGRTTVRRAVPPRVLELEADSGRLGTARIALEARPWGEETLLILDEHPLRGPGGLLHNAMVDAVAQLRHRGMLARLARCVERRRRPADGRR